jgi:hypothetical protein
MSAVTMQSIYQAISAYLVLGVMSAAISAAIDHLGGGHFFANSQPADAETFQYFCFTTLTTLNTATLRPSAPPAERSRSRRPSPARYSWPP